MKAKLKVLVPFTDKNDRTVRYKEGDTVFFDDIERVNDLVARKVCRLEAFEAEKPYTFSYGLGALIMSIGILVFLGIFFPKVGLIGDTLAIIMTLGTLSFLVTTPEVWVPNLGSGEFGFPLLSGAGRLVIKDIVILASAVVLLSDSSQRVLKIIKKD